MCEIMGKIKKLIAGTAAVNLAVLGITGVYAYKKLTRSELEKVEDKIKKEKRKGKKTIHREELKSKMKVGYLEKKADRLAKAEK